MTQSKQEFRADVVGALVSSRIAAGMSREDVAKKMQSMPATIYDFEGGCINATMDFLLSYAAACDVQLHVVIVEGLKKQ